MPSHRSVHVAYLGLDQLKGLDGGIGGVNVDIKFNVTATMGLYIVYITGKVTVFFLPGLNVSLSFNTDASVSSLFKKVITCIINRRLDLDLGVEKK